MRADPRKALGPPVEPGALAEYEDIDALVAAVGAIREAGYTALDAHSPFNYDELEAALDQGRSRLPWVALAAGLTGAVLAYGLQWWISAAAYPTNVGGRPLHSGPAFIPLTFETAILFAATAVFLGFMVRGGFPRLWAAVDEIPDFHRVTLDRYWLVVDRKDPRFDAAATASALKALEPAPLRVVVLAEDGAVAREERRRPDGSWEGAP